MSDKNKEQQNVVRRRGFLAGAATAGAAGAAVVATGVLSNKSTVDVVKDENASKGYQVSEHVRRYYRTTTV
jgi:nitrous oxide reductase